MTSREKRIERFCNITAEAESQEVIKVLEILGYEIKRIKGSHFIFERKVTGRTEIIIIPVHNNKVKKRYVTDIIKLIKQSENEKIQKI